MKNLNVNLNLEVADDLSEEEIAMKIKQIIAQPNELKEDNYLSVSGIEVSDPDNVDDLKDVKITILGTSISVEDPNKPVGYQSRLWSKATC